MIATATAVERDPISEVSTACKLMLPTASSTAVSTSACVLLAIRLSANDTPIATDAPNLPNAAATETAITLESILALSVARIWMKPSTSMPLTSGAPSWLLSTVVVRPT